MKSKNIQGIVFLSIYFLFANQALAAEWIYFASNSYRDSYYDKGTIIKVDKNIVRVLTKQILNENGKVKTLSSFRSKGKSSSNLDLLSYVLKQSEIDCVNRKIKDYSMIFYDEKSNLIYSSPKGDIGNWNDILPNSAAEKLKNILCQDPDVSKEPFVTVSVDNDKNLAQVITKQNEPQHIPEEDIRQMIDKWLLSWQSGEMETYRSFYDEHFESKNMKLNEWITYKTNVRNKSKNITISIDDLKISADGENAEAVFIQIYSSSVLKDKGKKTLKLKKVGNEWKIYREIM